ncbi:hypothetical protein GCM10010360_74810 [Streptomyces nogalater]
MCAGCGALGGGVDIAARAPPRARRDYDGLNRGRIDTGSSLPLEIMFGERDSPAGWNTPPCLFTDGAYALPSGPGLGLAPAPAHTHKPESPADHGTVTP